MGDPWSQYEDELRRLLMQLGRDHPRYTEALVLQQRLMENLARVRLYGDSETSRAERAQIVKALSRLALEVGDNSSSALFPTEFGRFIRLAGTIAFVGREPVIIGGSKAVQHHLEALEAARKAGERMAEGEALDSLGSVYAAQGNFHCAVEHYEQAIAIAHELGDHQAKAIYLQDLGLARLRLAEVEQDQRQTHLSCAADALRQAMESFDALGTAPLLRARTRYHLGRCYHQLGRWREAIQLLEQARETFSHHKARPELANALLELGRLYHQRQDFESAYIYLKDALRLFRRLEDTDGIAVAQEALGSLALQTARLPEAVASLQEARQGYATLRRSERIRAVDDLLRIAHQARQPVGGTAL
ncbi:MAG: tetratricopeptide repeat protein [Anaerolineae bacterium]|jgi:tetratricopeptide (TPR) repeat protein|nr:tetratricopeptide repeat protein [Anaerolineae bacterium]